LQTNGAAVNVYASCNRVSAVKVASSSDSSQISTAETLSLLQIDAIRRLASSDLAFISVFESQVRYAAGGIVNYENMGLSDAGMTIDMIETGTELLRSISDSQQLSDTGIKFNRKTTGLDTISLSDAGMTITYTTDTPVAEYVARMLGVTIPGSN
jgi:hypothetical protein